MAEETHSVGAVLKINTFVLLTWILHFVLTNWKTKEYWKRVDKEARKEKATELATATIESTNRQRVCAAQ